MPLVSALILAAVAVVELSSGAVDSVACSIEDLGAALAPLAPLLALSLNRHLGADGR